MPTFQDSDNISNVIVPDGDYVFCCTGFDASISSGGKTAGADKFSLDLALEVPGQGATVYENLIDHPSCAWKFDVFLKSSGVRLVKGEQFDFRRSVADNLRVRWINPIGLRGWCHITTEEYTPKAGGEKKKKNKVAIFYTDKQKLPPRVIEQAEEDTPF
jgi:hypothetical protein